MKEHVDISKLQDRHLDLMIRLSFDMDDMDEVQRLLDSPDPVLTPEEQAMAQEIFATAQTKAKNQTLTEKRRKTRQTAGRIAMRVIEAAACLILFAMIAVPVALAASPTFRARVMKLLIEMNPDTQEVHYTYVEDADASFDVPELWDGDYFPSYIPSGFELYDYNPIFTVAEYHKGISRLYFEEYDDGTDLTTGLEDSIFYETDINGCPAIVCESSREDVSFIHIIWANDDRWFSVSAYDYDRNEAFCVARSVRMTGLEHPVFTPDRNAPLAPPYGWMGTHYPTWLPDGWYASEFTIPGTAIIFSRNDDEQLWFASDGGLSVSLSLFVVSDIVEVNGQIAWLYGKGSIPDQQESSGIIWLSGNTTLKMQSDTLTTDELLKIARSVQPVDGNVSDAAAPLSHPVWPHKRYSEINTLFPPWPYSCIPTKLPEDYYYIEWMWNHSEIEIGFWDGIRRCVFYAEIDAPDIAALTGYEQVSINGKTGWLTTEQGSVGHHASRMILLWQGETCWHRLSTINYTVEETIDVAQSVQPFDPTKGGEVQ